jgi:hypothetical protein
VIQADHQNADKEGTVIETAPDKYTVDALYERYVEDFYNDPRNGPDSEPMERDAWRESPEGRAALARYERVRSETVQRAEQVRGLFQTMPGAETIEELGEDGNASGGFADGCDSYQGFAFSAYVDGRHYYVTVEDVTIKEDA